MSAFVDPLVRYPDLAGMELPELRREWDRLNLLEPDPEAHERRYAIGTLIYRTVSPRRAER